MADGDGRSPFRSSGARLAAGNSAIGSAPLAVRTENRYSVEPERRGAPFDLVTGIVQSSNRKRRRYRSVFGWEMAGCELTKVNLGVVIFPDRTRSGFVLRSDKDCRNGTGQRETGLWEQWTEDRAASVAS